MNTELMFSSKFPEWETPDDFFQGYHKRFHFTLDVCANRINHKVERYFSDDGSGIAENGLSQDWSNDVCWMNPPYGREIKKWVKKAYEESLKGATVVCLLPSRTDTGWFWDYCMKGEVQFIRGRIKFLIRNAKNQENVGKFPAPFPSVVVIFRP